MTNQKTIYLSIGSKGGCGKSTSLMLVANYLRSKGIKPAIIDCDLGNHRHASSFSNWFGGKTELFDIRRQQDLDGILECSAGASTNAIMVDLPANSLCNVQSWFEDICTPATLDEIGIRLVCVASVAPVLGSVEGVLSFMEVVGYRTPYLVALNRLEKDFAPQPLSETFKEWLSVDLTGFHDVHAIEIGHLDSFAMNDLVKGCVLPCNVDSSDIKHLVRLRVKAWANKVNKQLDETGLFVSDIECSDLDSARSHL